MKINGIKRFLDVFNVDTSGTETDWLQIPELERVYLNTDGNQGISFLGSRVKFDFENEILKIKKYYWQFIGGQFYTESYTEKISDTTGKIICKINPFLGSYTYRKVLNSRAESVPLPRIGDKLFLVNPNTNKKVDGKEAVITDIRRESDGVIVEYNGNIHEGYKKEVICYANKDLYDSSYNLELDNRIMIYLIEQTTNKTDIYLGFEEISGFLVKRLG